MTPKEALEYLVQQIYNKSSCGRLTEKEREAVNILRKIINGNE